MRLREFELSPKGRVAIDMHKVEAVMEDEVGYVTVVTNSDTYRVRGGYQNALDAWKKGTRK